MDIQPELAPYFNDYKIHVVDVAFLTDAELDAYRSDFRIAAEYFVQAHRTGEYDPRPQPVRHIHDTLQMMQVLTGDRRFERSLAVDVREGRDVTMIDMLSRIENRGIERGVTLGREQGLTLGREQGLTQGRIDIARNMLINGLPHDMIAKCTDLPLDRIGKIADELGR